MERPFDYPGRHAEPEFKLYERLGSFTVESDDGESYSVYTTYTFHHLADADEVTETIDRLQPATHCQHEHDCCGRFYASRAQWDFARKLDSYSSGETATVVVKQGFSCNI